MRKYAEMKYGKIHSIFPDDDYQGPDFTLEQIRNLFAPDVMAIEITNQNPVPQVGWKYEDGEFREGKNDNT